MKIREGKNLRYTKLPYQIFEPLVKVDPAKCILETFHSHNDRLESVRVTKIFWKLIFKGLDLNSCLN